MTVRNFKPNTTAAAGAARGERRLREQDGFTIVEVLVATLVLVAGLLTTFLMLDVALHSSSGVRGREGAVTLARQITEDARSIPYSQISNSTIASTLQGMPGLANTSGGSNWTIVRNGFTYTVTASVTTVNDPKDSSGGVDLKQVKTTLTWSTFQGKSHSISETTTVSKAGQDPGLIATGLQLSSPAWGTTAGLSGTGPTAPVITSTGITSLQFSVTAPSGTTAIVWSLNGGKQSSWNGSAPSSGTTWTSAAWSLSGVSDGTYTVGAQAEDSSGVDGPAVTISVRLIRNVPSAPTVTAYGFNNATTVGGPSTTVAELQWSTNPEQNVVGYQISNSSNTTICQTSTSSYGSCGLSGAQVWCASATTCIVLNQPSNLTYTIKALYYDANNNLQAGNGTSVTLTSGTPSPPPQVALVNLTAVTQPDNTAIITWTPVTGGTPVSFYRIYRDGINYTNRYDTVAASSCSATCTYHDTNRISSHNYFITSVGGTTPGSNMAESAPTGPVTG
jgi:Tfp pilus assembly protein PilV